MINSVSISWDKGFYDMEGFCNLYGSSCNSCINET